MQLATPVADERPRRQRRLPRPGRRARRRRRDRRRRRGGALLAPQARQAAGRRSRPGSCPSRRWRWCLERGRPRRRPTSTRSPTPTTPRSPSQPDGDITAGRAGRACARSTRGARRCSCSTALPGLDPARCAACRTTSRTPPRRRSRPASTRAACSCSTAAASAPRTSPGRFAGGALEVLAAQALPHSLGLLYEELTAHLGFRRSSDEYKVMAMASYAAPALPRRVPRARARRRRRRLPRRRTSTSPRFAPAARARARSGRRRTRDARRDRAAAPGGGPARPRALAARAHGRPRPGDGRRRRAQLRGQLADLARGPVRARLGAAGRRATRARRSAPRCTSRTSSATRSRRWPTAALGRGWDDAALAALARDAPDVAFERPGRRRRRGRRGARRQPGRRVVPGPRGVRAARARAPLAARRPAPTRRTSRSSTTSRAASSSGRSRRWCSPSARPRSSRAGRSRARSCSSRTRVRDGWAERIPAVVHVDGTARIQTVDRASRAAVARCLERFEARTGVPVVVNTSPQHRRAADGRRPARRAGVLRLRARRRCSRSGRSSCAAHGRRARPARAGGARRRVTLDVVIPSAGRPIARALLAALARRGRARASCRGRRPARRRRRRCSTRLPARRARRARAGARARRGAQRRLARVRAAEWVAFLDDDVEPAAGLARRAAARPRRRAGPTSAACRGGSSSRCRAGRRPTDWERNIAGLERARWATADLAYRRAALEAVGGFDERFPRAYREDADLGLRVTARGLADRARATRGRAPSRAARRRRWVSLAKQAGNADDVLMRALHGRGWRERAGVPRGPPPAPPRDRRRGGALAAGARGAGRRARRPPSPARPGSPARPSSPGRASRPARATPREVATMAVDERG